VCRRAVLLVLFALFVVVHPAAAQQPNLVARTLSLPAEAQQREVRLWVAEDLESGVFADGLPSARMLAESPSGELLLSQTSEGRVATR
jgi:glucose/arabinose dehydrogenase